jgi:hypothetical protein
MREISDWVPPKAEGGLRAIPQTPQGRRTFGR